MARADDHVMNSTTYPDRGLVDVVVVLVGLQAAILVVSTLEALAAASFLGPAAAGPALLTAGAAVITAVTAYGLGRRSRWARRWALIAEGAVLAVALLDVVALPMLTGGDAALVSILSRVVAPVVVITLLRRPPVRAAFIGVPA